MSTAAPPAPRPPAACNAVTVLVEGYCRPSTTDPDRVTHSNCTSTLIRSKSGKYIVVDTLTPWHREHLIAALALHDLRPSDIAYLVCTHGHSDHVGNNNLFVGADTVHIVGHDVNTGDAYSTVNNIAVEPMHLVDGIEVVASPGHTMQCVSVRVPDCGPLGDETVIVAGDLFECEADIERPSIWVEAGTQCERSQRTHRCRMAGDARYIVPGHGPMFAVTEAMRDKLRCDLASGVMQKGEEANTTTN